MDDGLTSGDDRATGGAPDVAGTDGGGLGDRAPAATREDIMRRRRRWRRRRRRRRIVLLILVVLMIPVTFVTVDYVRYLREPSSLDWKIRTVEYFREHHMAWLVNTAEDWYYTATAPEKGGPDLTALPDVGGGDPSPDASSASPSVKPSAKPTKKPDYRPPRVEGAIKPWLADEGVWKTAGQSVAGEPAVLATSFRSETDYPRIVTYAVWIDSTRTRLALYPGRYQPPKADPRGPMMIPYGQRKWALAAFNSGFTRGDLGGGWAINGKVLDALAPGRGTIVAWRNGKVDVVAWRAGYDLRKVVLARQNLPLIVIDGKPNPALNETQQWGYTLHNKVRVWRSAVGVDRKGNLVYTAADQQTVVSLAEGLVRAGAVRAIELDINAAWPTFNVYWRPGCQHPVQVVPRTQEHTTRYLYPDDRDFFVVYKKKKRVEGNPGVTFE